MVVGSFLYMPHFENRLNLNSTKFSLLSTENSGMVELSWALFCISSTCLIYEPFLLGRLSSLAFVSLHITNMLHYNQCLSLCGFCLYKGKCKTVCLFTALWPISVYFNRFSKDRSSFSVYGMENMSILVFTIYPPYTG